MTTEWRINNMSNITIFEGPDGAGKTTTAIKYANSIGAQYVHFPVLQSVTSNLARIYAEAMLPAIQCYNDVVLDRCWISELHYGKHYRNNCYRLSLESVRMLERIVLSKRGVLVMCLPRFNTVLRNFESRRNLELLPSSEYLAKIYNSYADMSTKYTDLPIVLHDYESGEYVTDHINKRRFSLNGSTDIFGNVNSKILVVVNPDHTYDNDLHYKIPGVSFGKNSASQKITKLFSTIGIPESLLAWVFSDIYEAKLLRKYEFVIRLDKFPIDDLIPSVIAKKIGVII